MAKKKIGVDFDHTILDYDPPFIEFLNSNYGTNFRPGELYLENFSKLINFGGKSTSQIVDEFLDTPAFSDLKPMPFAVQVLQELQSEFDFFGITSRHKRFREISALNVERYFGPILQGTFFAYNPYALHGKEFGTKGQICSREGIEYLVDDSVTITLDCVANRLAKLLLFNPNAEDLKRVNGYLSDGSVIPVTDWREVKIKLLDLKSQSSSNTFS